MISKNYDAVIFDLDGTLIDSMWVWEKLDIAFLGQLSIKVPEDMDRELEGMSFTETASYFKERFKLEMSVEAIKESWNKLAWDFYTRDVTLKTGAKEFLAYLQAKGIKLGIASSNSTELIDAVLEALQIKQYFSGVRSSCEVGRGKPYPDIYLKVAEDLKVEPNRCLVFEDIPNGIKAGKAAGMYVCGIRDRQSQEVQEEAKALAHHFIKDYYEAMSDFAFLKDE